MKIKPIAGAIIAFLLGAAVGAYLMLESAVKEHQRLMRLEHNSEYINSLKGVSTGTNVVFSGTDFDRSVAECMVNSAIITESNSKPSGDFSIQGWKDYGKNGIIAYTYATRLGRESPIYACIFDLSGELEETRRVWPLPNPNENLIKTRKKPSFLEVNL